MRVLELIDALVQVDRVQADETHVTGGPGTRSGTPWEAALPLVGAVLSLLFATHAVLHLVLLEGSVRLVLAGLTGVLAVVTLTGSLIAWWRGLADGAVRPLAATFVVLLAADAMTAMVATDELGWSVVVLLAIVAAGALLSRPRWLIGTLYVVWGLWLTGVVVVEPQPMLPVYAVSMVAGTALSAGVMLGSMRMTDTLTSVRELAEVVAVRDPLTGLANRRGLQMLAAPIVESARRQGDAVHAVLLAADVLIGPDGSHSCPVGDEAVLSLGEAIAAVTRATDVVARWDSRTFVIVGPGPGMSAAELERRVRDRLVVVAAFESGWSPRVSAGGAMLAPWDAGNLDSLLEAADRELDRRCATHHRERRSDHDTLR